MYEELLREIGLSINESKVYEALLEIGESSVQTISLRSKVHRRNVYDSLAKLGEKGLALEVFVKGEKRFKAMHPSRLLELLKEKEERISKALPEMKAKYESIEEKEEAYFYRGTEGFKNYLQSILETKETVYFIGAKAFWLDPRLKHYLTRFDNERKRLCIQFKHLFDYEIKEQKPEILKLVGKPYKFLPKKYSSQTAVDIFGDYVVTFVGVQPGSLYENPVQFVLKSRRLADGYKKFFQFMWDNCKEE
ncbi:MAG: helix-turn-helix domain-containing protein [Nanoarchaeota archaeon]|nr:helix-turn-helix domain-containing protein [Nanoarchaeota archaeon]MBU1854207.1 helix-turn-helix domain-containing protein [Nanoarchaeota archaeon]